MTKNRLSFESSEKDLMSIIETMDSAIKDIAADNTENGYFHCYGHDELKDALSDLMKIKILASLLVEKVDNIYLHAAHVAAGRGTWYATMRSNKALTGDVIR